MHRNRKRWRKIEIFFFFFIVPDFKRRNKWWSDDFSFWFSLLFLFDCRFYVDFYIFMRTTICGLWWYAQNVTARRSLKSMRLLLLPLYLGDEWNQVNATRYFFSLHFSLILINAVNFHTEREKMKTINKFNGKEEIKKKIDSHCHSKF